MTKGFAVELRGLVETTLIASADSAFWRTYLEASGLAPLDVDGKAEILLAAAAGRRFGVPVREFTASVALRPERTGAAPPRRLLLAAFSSSRVVAAYDRAASGGPLRRADVRVAVAPTAWFAIMERGTEAIRAERSPRVPSEAPRPEVTVEEVVSPRSEGGVLRSFSRRTEGCLETRIFEPTTDVLAFRFSHAFPAVELLRASRAAGRDWRIRTSGTRWRTSMARIDGSGAAAET